MIISIVPIGNSKGIRIPKNILKQLNIGEKVELEVHNNEILLKPVNNHPRAGWKEAFTLMAERGEDKLLLPETEDQDLFEWEW